MANEAKKSKLDQAKAKAVQNSKKKRRGNFFKEAIAELKKVHWPTKAEVVKFTLVVLVFCLIMAIVIWVVDSVFNLGLRQLLGL
jgi:preprotein translocase subunit SecE